MTPTVPDGPDTELTAAIAYFRDVDDLRAEMRFYEAWGHAAAIVRAVLAHPAAGRDLTARDVEGAFTAWLRGSRRSAGQPPVPLVRDQALDTIVAFAHRNAANEDGYVRVLNALGDLGVADDEIDRARPDLDEDARDDARRTDGQPPADAPPVYLAADVWAALHLPDAEFAGYYERNGWAETWAVLMAAVRGPGRCGRDVDGAPCVLAPHSESTPCHGTSDVGSSEPLPWRAAPADDTAPRRFVCDQDPHPAEVPCQRCEADATAAYPRVAGRCPSCGRESLRATAGGHVVCMRLECPSPTAADDLLHGGPPQGLVPADDTAAPTSAGPHATVTPDGRLVCVHGVPERSGSPGTVRCPWSASHMTNPSPEAAWREHGRVEHGGQGPLRWDEESRSVVGGADDDTAAPDGPVTLPIDELFWIKDWAGTRASWRCLLAKSIVDEGYTSGACRYDHNCDTRASAYAEARAHLRTWHHLAAGGSSPASTDGGEHRG